MFENLLVETTLLYSWAPSLNLPPFLVLPLFLPSLFPFLLLEVSPTAGPASSSSTAPNSSPSPSPTPSSFSSSSSTTTLTQPNAPLPPNSPSQHADSSPQPNSQSNAPANTSQPSNPAPGSSEVQSDVLPGELSPVLPPAPPPPLSSSSSSSSPTEGEFLQWHHLRRQPRRVLPSPFLHPPFSCRGSERITKKLVVFSSHCWDQSVLSSEAVMSVCGGLYGPFTWCWWEMINYSADHVLDYVMSENSEKLSNVMLQNQKQVNWQVNLHM